jgi:hypothetical protein
MIGTCIAAAIAAALGLGQYSLIPLLIDLLHIIKTRRPTNCGALNRLPYATSIILFRGWVRLANFTSSDVTSNRDEALAGVNKAMHSYFFSPST